MDLQLVIPTHDRPEKQTTFESLPPFLRRHTLLVVSTRVDYDILKAKYGAVCGGIFKASVDSISAKRQWIMENIDAPKIMMMDDDMTFFTRCPASERIYYQRWTTTGVQFLAKSTEEQFKEMFDAISEQLDGAAHVGLSSRMGNDTVEQSWLANTRMMHAIGYHREVFLKEKLDFREMPVREDFNITLRLLRRGYANYVYHESCCSPGSYGAPGGVTDERTLDSSNEYAEKLAEMHPGLVRVVEKEYKNSPRKEVVVSWKKAFGYDL